MDRKQTGGLIVTDWRFLLWTPNEANLKRIVCFLSSSTRNRLLLRVAWVWYHDHYFICVVVFPTLIVTVKPLTHVASKCRFCLRFAQYIVSCTGFISNYNSCDIWHTLYLQWYVCNGLFAMNYLRWQLDIIVASCCMSYHWKAYEIWRITMKTIWKSDENWLGNHRSKIFSMLKLLLQAIASKSNVQSQVNRK